ncbi:MAG TPA: serine protease, partial [Anaeromyxobacteraceae bacterium]|nr:serine protease [Anaeromyxobacteraceae bacterium]
MNGFALVTLLFSAAAAGPARADQASDAPASFPLPPRSDAAPYCSGEYADSLEALSASARAFDHSQPPNTFCVRTSAVYECPSYGADGSLRTTRKKVVSHGTGFGFRQQPGETLIVTNEHVSDWPAVTDDDHRVSDVPAGCRRVSSALRIVDDESDAYEKDDVPLSRAVSDAALDVAILRAKAQLPVVPWKLGKSAALRERNAVDVRGFPLGVLRANNVGKVISTYTHHDEQGWDHDDFVIDALLSPGNSGSPVFAVSCKTGEFELVGVYHARYTKGSALNVVVGVDQIRDLITTLKKSPRLSRDEPLALDSTSRAELVDRVRATPEPFFPFGNLAAAVRSRSDGALVFEVMSREFPLQGHPALVLEDLVGSAPAFGRLGRVWAGNAQGLREAPRSELDADANGTLVKLLDALRRDALLTFRYRAAARDSASTRERFQDAKRLERTLRQSSSSRGSLGDAGLELAEQMCPRFADAPATLADVLTLPVDEPQLLGPLDAHGAPPPAGVA